MEDQSESKRKGLKLHHVVTPPTSFHGWEVQLTMPVDNPVYNVRMKSKKRCYIFEVPINYPNVHNAGFEELFQAQARSKKFALSTDLNKNSLDSSTQNSNLEA